MMTKSIFLGLLAAAALIHTGCKSPYYADRGAAFGAATGALAGAVIGEHNDNPLAGAAIGAVAGTILGSAVGQSIDDDVAQERAIIESRIGRQMAGATTIPDVVAMTQSGVSDQVIISYVQKKGMAQPLQVNDVLSLKQQGVSDGVITAMNNAPLASQQVTYQQPVTRPLVVEERVYVTPGYCAPPRHYYHHHHRHHHHRDPGVHLGFHFD